jgi:hypothetical protein
VTTSLLLPGLLLVLLLAWPLYNVMLMLCTVPPAKPVQVAARPAAHVRHYWIVIPALNEEKVIANTVNAALALHTPRTPVRVLVVDDASDDRTAVILDGIQNPRLHVLRRELPDARTGKGEALNAAYNWIRSRADAEGVVTSTIIGVIDGDGRGSDGLLDVVDALFDDRQVGAVQCRVRIHNRQRMLGLLQDIEFSCVANASQMLRDVSDSVGMGGNGQFARLAELARFGDHPWSRCLVEDLELGLRLHLNGVRIRYSRSAMITQQAVVDPKRLLRQRTRWAQGNLQCAGYLKQLLRSRQVGSVGLLDYLHYLVAPWLVVPMSLLVGATAVATLVLITVGSSFRLVASGEELGAALVTWVGAMLAPGLLWGLVHRLRNGDEPLWRCALAGLCYPAFLLIGVSATWYALVRHVLGHNSWAKTDRLDETPDATTDATTLSATPPCEPAIEPSEITRPILAAGWAGPADGAMTVPLPCCVEAASGGRPFLFATQSSPRRAVDPAGSRG